MKKISLLILLLISNYNFTANNFDVVLAAAALAAANRPQIFRPLKQSDLEKEKYLAINEEKFEKQANSKKKDKKSNLISEKFKPKKQERCKRALHN